MGEMVKHYKNTYYKRDDGYCVYFYYKIEKYITQEMVENLLEGKPATFKRKSLFGYSENSLKLESRVSEKGFPYGSIVEDKEIATYDDRPTVKGALNRIIPNDFMEKAEVEKHIKGVLDSLSLIKEYKIFVETLAPIDDLGDKFIHFTIYRDYKYQSGLHNPQYQVMDKYLRYENNSFVDECTELVYLTNKNEYKIKANELKAKKEEEQLQRNIENLKENRKKFILPTVTNESFMEQELQELFDEIWDGKYNEYIDVEITSYKDNACSRYNHMSNEEITMFCKNKNTYVEVSIPYLNTIYLEYDEDNNLIGKITQAEYKKAIKSIEDEYGEYTSNKRKIQAVRSDLYSEYSKVGLAELVSNVDIDNVLNLDTFNKFSTGMVKKQGESAAVEYICFDFLKGSLNAELLKEELLNILKIYYEFNNISAKNIASLAPFIVNNNLKKYYDDMLLYDEAIEPIIKNSKDKKLLSRVLKRIAGTSLAATYADRNSTFYFERKVRAKNIVMNPVQLLNELVALIPEYNDRSDVVVLFNIILNADESFTYQFYTFAEDESGGDMDGRRVGNMTRIYNRHHKTPIAFEYE